LDVVLLCCDGQPNTCRPGEDKTVGGNQDCDVQNIAEDALLFETAGIGISLTQATSLATGLRKLAEKEPVKSVRFWGKVTGTMRDYLIAECRYTDPTAHEAVASTDPPGKPKPGSPEPVPLEKIGEGLNSYVYYVVGYEYGPDGIFGHYTYDKWIKLPPLRPDHIMAARKIKKLFTGMLDSPVNAYPPFPGNEAEYLAAQIARITRGATMTIDGLWAVEEVETDDGTEKVIKQKEVGGEDPFEIKKTGPEGLTAPEGAWKTSWVHHPMYPSLLTKMGRCTWPVKPPNEDGDVEEDENKEEGEPDNKNLEEEAPIYGDLASHSVRLATPALGDFSPAVLRSNRWPGAHTVAIGIQCVNVYVGDGMKYTGQPFQLAMPPVLPAECSDMLQGEDGEPGEARPGMKEQLDESMPDPFLVVDGGPEDGEGDVDA